MLSLFRNRSFAIDLGNTNTVLADRDRILLSEPSCIVIDSSTNRVRAVGDKAYEMFEKNHRDLRPIRPLKWGVIADYGSATMMIRDMVKRTFTGNLLGGYDQIIAGVPFCTTEVERRALRDTLDQFNPKKRHLIYEPIAAAIGMGLDIREPEGKMLIDIGGGITEVVIISLSGVVVFQSIKVAGDSFTEDIQDYLRRVYNLQVGWKTAEQVKISVGAVSEKLDESPEPIYVKGKDIMTGLPSMRRIDHREIAQILDKSMLTIEQHILHAMEACPPELSADIYQSGIFVTGGGSLLRGMRERLQRSMQLPVHMDDEPLLAVSKGTSIALRQMARYRSVLMN
jgi:rod shape-determining protein MreB and related proteins